MKTKILFTSLLLCSSQLGAQNQIETYSVYDVDHDQITSVADATRVVSRAIEETKVDPQVVDAATLNSLLLELKSEIQQVNTRLSVIENKLRIGASDTPEDISDPFNGHEYVDLGLKDEQGRTIYWATCNVGAEKPEDYGLYFAWGETLGYDTKSSHSFSWDIYELSDGTADKLKKYCTDNSYGTIDNKTILESEDDAAQYIWRGNWRMPTRAEIEMLIENCVWTWTEINGNNGYMVANPNDENKYIFLPAAGYRLSIINSYNCGMYWSSTSKKDAEYYPNHSSSLFFRQETRSISISSASRCEGHSIRPVCVLTE